MIVSLEAQGTNAYNRYAMCPAGLPSIRFLNDKEWCQYAPSAFCFLLKVSWNIFLHPIILFYIIFNFSRNESDNVI